MHQYPENSGENIYFLEKTLSSDFANPLNAMTKIENEIEWEKYRYLFKMHVNLKLIENYISLGQKYNKNTAYFFNYPFKQKNLKSLKMAEKCFQKALYYWKDTTAWAEKASERKFIWIFFESIQYWDDERYRIQNNELNYKTIIDGHLKRLQKVREDFEAMNPDTY